MIPVRPTTTLKLEECPMQTDTAPSRRRLLQLAAAAAATPALSSLFATQALAAETLDVLMSPSPLHKDVLALFESKTQITVRGAPYVSPTNTTATLLSGGNRLSMLVTTPDLVKPAFASAVDQRRLLPFDTAAVPNLAQVAPRFRDDILTQGGRTYAIPLIWGYNGVVYNRKLIQDDDPALASWGILFDDKFKGRVAIRDDAQEMISMAALYLGHKKPAAMTAAELKDTIRFLISKKGNFRTLWSKFAEALQLITANEVSAMYGWLTMKSSLQKQGADVNSNQPKEGLLFWVQSAFMPAQAPNPQAAHSFANFLLSAEGASTMTKGTGVPSPSLLGKNAFSPEEQKVYGYDILESNAAMVRIEPPEDMSTWLEAWADFKAA